MPQLSIKIKTMIDLNKLAEQDLNQDVEFAKDFTKKLLKKVGLERDYEIIISSRMTSAAGKCRSICNPVRGGWHGEIKLSSVIIPKMKTEGIKNTIIHEVAHSLTPGDGHGRAWRNACINLGGDGRIYYNDNCMKKGGGDRYVEKT